MDNNVAQLKTLMDLIVPIMANYLDESQKGNTPVLKQRNAAELSKLLQLEYWIRKGGIDNESIIRFMRDYLENSQHMHHPKYIGHQVSVPHIASGVADFINGISNNPMAIYEMGPSAATIERVIVNWMLEKVGWFSGELSNFDKNNNGIGVLVHGGSIANLTAMLAARAEIAPDAWTTGNPRGFKVFVPETAHYSIARSVSIIGLGQNTIVPIAVNEKEVLNPDALYPALIKSKEQGKRIMAVVANACATSTGLYDPIKEVGAFCKENKLWFHIDGAHGAAALISAKERHLLEGASVADSIIWDAHKMLRTSVLCAAVLFKKPKHLAQAFQQKGSYIFHDKEQPGFDSMPYTIERTKSGLGNKLFWVLATEGENNLAKFVEGRFGITRKFHKYIDTQDDFESPYEPQANILCFRFTAGQKDNDYQLSLRNKLIQTEAFYITSAIVNNIRYLRLTIINPLTTMNHLIELLDAIRSIAKDQAIS